MYAKKIQKLIELFSCFPGIGPRTAGRFVFYLTHAKGQEVDDLTEAIQSVKKSLKYCSFCSKLFEEEGDLCEICSNKLRDRTMLCVVENETNLVSIENKKIYKGLYFVLGNGFSDFKKQNLEQLRIESLKQAIKTPEKFGIVHAKFEEIILAFNSTTNGKLISLYLLRELKALNKKITCLGLGLPAEGELEYMDKQTLISAFGSRR